MKKSTAAVLGTLIAAAAAAAGFFARGQYDRRKKAIAAFYESESDYCEDEMMAFCLYYGVDDPGEYFKVEKAMKL